MARKTLSRAVFDLGHMARLTYDPGLVLLISERTSYILHNLAIADVEDMHRYAIYPPIDGNYQPLSGDDPPEILEIFYAIREAFRNEILEVAVLPLPIAPISSVASELKTGTASVSTSYLYSEEVPDGEAWEVESWRVKASTAITLIEIEGINQSAYLARYASPAAGVEQYGFGPLTLGPGAKLRYAFYGCTPNVTTLTASISYRIIPLPEEE